MNKALPGERWFPDENTFLQDMNALWGDWGVSSETGKLKAVIMRRPGKEIEDFDYRAARFYGPIDPELFRKQHDDLTEIYRAHGVDVHLVEGQRSDRPNALFMRDIVFMTPEGAIVTRPAMSLRRGEERATAKKLAELGVPIIRTINGDGIFEGAMGLWIDAKTVVLARGARCNQSGFDQVSYELERMGVTQIIPMQIPYGHAHIDGLLNMIRPDLAMIFASQVPYDVCDALKKKGIELLECPDFEEAKTKLAINYVALEPGKIVMVEGNPRSQELIESKGVDVITVDVSEILKGYGAIHCMTAFLKREE
jgi:N-dimethylarginine dimethylaminohydrolase